MLSGRGERDHRGERNWGAMVTSLVTTSCAETTFSISGFSAPSPFCSSRKPNSTSRNSRLLLLRISLLFVLISSFWSFGQSVKCYPLDKITDEFLEDKGQEFPRDCHNLAKLNARATDSDTPSIFFNQKFPTHLNQSIIAQAFRGIGLLEAKCRIPLTILVCGSAYPLCDEDGVPIPVCEDICTRAIRHCKKFFDISLIIKKCDRFFVAHNSCLPYSNASADELVPECDPPFVLDKDRDPPCRAPCLNPLLSDPTRVAATELKMWLSVLSLIADITIIFGVLTSKERRAFPGNLIAFVAFAQLLLAITFIIGYMIGYEKVMCRDKRHPSTQFDYGYCGFEGAMIYLSTSTLACYWLVLSFNLFLAAVVGVRFASDQFSLPIVLLYHFFAWGLPISGLIPMLAVEAFGYKSDVWWCWILHDIDLYTFWVWLGLFCVLVAVFIVWSAIAMYRIRKTVGRGTLRQNLHLLFFVNIYFVIFGYSLGLWFKDQAANRSWIEALKKSEDCLIRNLEELGDSDCDIKTPFIAAEMIVQIILLCSSGVALFFAFELRSDFIPHWKKVLTLLAKGDLRGIAKLP